MSNTAPVLNPYLFFNGRCQEAIAFYEKAIGAKALFVMHYRDAPPEAKQHNPPNSDDKVMHATLRIGNSTVMAADDCSGRAKTFGGFALSLTASSAEEAERLFKALAEGGHVGMPLAKTFFSPSFGMLTDRFGVMWMVYVEGTHS